MLTPSHLLIGQVISKTLRSNTNWNYSAFQCGCVIPDLLYSYPRHNYNDSQAFITSLIKRLRRIRPESGSNSANHYYFFNLGIVCHYLSDYFCRAHNDFRYVKLYPHLRYEYCLGPEFNRHNLTRLCSSGLATFKPGWINNFESIEDFIARQHKAYLSESERMSKDIIYALQTTTVVIASIISSSKYNVLLSPTA